jgi:tetratricopeptide (TPR) repeat protein
LELDSRLAEAYVIRGLLALYYEWDFVAAEKDLTTALELEPNNDMAHWGSALLYTNTGRFELALKEIESAQGIAPGTSIYERERGKIPYYARRYDEAIVLLKRHVELVPDTGQIWLSRAYEMKGDYAAAFEAFIQTQKDPQRVEVFRTTFKTTGWQGVTRKFIEFSLLDEQNGKQMGLLYYKIAIAFAQLGEKDQAFVYLNKMVAERAWQVSQLYVDPLVDPLRGDPRFEAIIKLIRQ